MKINEKRVISYLIVVVPLALVLTASFFITTFYIDKVNAYFKKVKEISIAEHIESKKAKSEIWVDQLNLLFDYKTNRLADGIKTELKQSVDMAYDSARYIYEKYDMKKSAREIKERIIDSQMAFNAGKSPIFMVSFNGENILPRSLKLSQKNIIAYEDANHRAIILEEIQKARKYQEGFLESDFYEQKQSYITYVKNLNIYDYYIGSSINVENKRDSLKSELLEMLKSIPMDRADFMGLYEAKEPIFLSKKMSSYLGDNSLEFISTNLSEESKWHKDTLDNFYYYSKYYEPLDWYLVYGFETSKMSKKELEKQNQLEQMLDNELDFILSASAAIVIFVVVLSLLLSRKINGIFLEYQDEVQRRADELEKLNESLEQRVADGLREQRQKDKMLIQQSKMAEMGDMLSMIAHQWRQPLNQMSYLFMNIDSAYEHKELTKEYLDEKLVEANAILEFMSVTIDDFRNYFRPDKSKEFVLVSDVVNTSVSLMQKSLELSGIELELDTQGQDLTHIYKNEFIQVMLNLIKNAKDILVEKEVQSPKITIKTRCQKEKLVVEVCDNAGGIDEAIKEKIFEPYFSTKDKHNGTGLGLYMSKMIIEEHLGGSLSVSNMEDGVCFRIEI